MVITRNVMTIGQKPGHNKLKSALYRQTSTLALDDIMLYFWHDFEK